MFIYSSQLAPIVIDLAYSCGLRHSIWSEFIHENLILENQYGLVGLCIADK